MAANALLAMHIYEQPAHLTTVAPDIPEPLATLVHRMLAKTAADRPSAQQVFLATEQLAGMLGTTLSSPQLNLHRSDPSALAVSDSQRNASTLGTATGQSAEKLPPPRRRMRARIGGALLGGGLLLAGITTLVLRSQHPMPPGGRAGNGHTGTLASLAPPANPSQSPAIAKVTTDKLRPMWTVQSDPAGAQVVRDSDGVVLGVTPWHGEQPSQNEPIAVHLRLSGYSERTLILQPGTDVIYSPTLSPKGKRSHNHGQLKDQPDPKDASGNELPKATPKHDQPEIAD